MSIRSFLFVPGDSERKQAKALGSAADALILDLEDSVAAARLPIARDTAAALLRSKQDRGPQELWVRVNALSSGKLVEDLVAVLGAAPDGLVLPKVSSPQEVLEITHYLTALEQREGLPVGSTRLLVIATETPQALLTLGTYTAAAAHPRLAGLTWGAEDLGAALGVTSRVDAQGERTFVFQLARSTCLLTAAALNVQAIDSVHPDYRDAEGLKREAAAARRDGFTGKMAIHPDQVQAINEAFTPSAAELEHARRVIAAFEAAPEAGVTSLDGAMIDKPHLVQAQRILSAAERVQRPGGIRR
jgi:citrate lyase subunit beta / citryl-CoA lyase